MKPSLPVQTSLAAGMAQPEVQTKTKTTTKQKQKEKQKVGQDKKTFLDDPVDDFDRNFEDAPMFKVMLLSDEEYETEHVVERICSIMDDMHENEATEIVNQAMEAGKAMCGVYPFERAELFREQLMRSDPMIFVEVEEE